MSIMPTAGHTALAELAKAQPLHVAWGPGDGAWQEGEVPDEDIDAIGLIAELGRRLPTRVEYCEPLTGDDYDDEDPAYVKVPNKGWYHVVAEPTRYLLIVAQFQYEEEPTATIRQSAVFMGTQIVDGLPAGQRYFTPDQIQSAGRMLQLQNLPKPLPRDSEYRTRLTHVLEF